MSKHSHHGHGNSGQAGQEKEAGELKGNPQGNNAPGFAAGSSKNPGQESQVNDTNKAEGDSKIPEVKQAALEAELADQLKKSAELEIKLAELNDQYLRKAADFENFRKRVNREKQELTEFANQNLLLDLLPVIDDFERAIKSAESSRDFTSFYDGIIMIEKGLTVMLENKWGLKRFNSAGELFDPNRHEAIQMEKSADAAEAVVKEDFLKGYTLKDRVIRFAKVKVLMPENSAGQDLNRAAGGAAASPPAGEDAGSGDKK